MSYVLDACAMIAYLKGEAGAPVVDQAIRHPGRVCYAHAINLCEVYYDALRAGGEATATQAIEDLLAAGIVERGDIDRVFWRSAGTIKSRGRISIADSFCAALAQRLGAETVTSDRAEFEPLASAGVCAVLFIR